MQHRVGEPRDAPSRRRAGPWRCGTVWDVESCLAREPAHQDLERFVIELSRKNSKIEGNTQPHAEDVMILNHKRAFDYIWQHRHHFRQATRQNIEQVHELLMQGPGRPRSLSEGAVGSTGTVYMAPASSAEITSYLDVVLRLINNFEPVEEALACLMLRGAHGMHAEVRVGEPVGGRL